MRRSKRFIDIVVAALAVAIGVAVSEPARLAILTALTACQKADFASLKSMTGLAQGNLSRHLQKLEKGRLITIDKQFKGKYPQTWLEVTVAGRSALQEHWRRIETSKTEVDERFFVHHCARARGARAPRIRCGRCSSSS